MAFCPQCGTEYREGTATCIDCGATLSPGPPPEEADDTEEPEGPLSCIRTFNGPTAPMQAGLARNLLLEEGIPCVLEGGMMAGMPVGLEPVSLLVRESDADSADEILKAFLESSREMGDE